MPLVAVSLLTMSEPGSELTAGMPLLVALVVPGVHRRILGKTVVLDPNTSFHPLLRIGNILHPVAADITRDDIPLIRIVAAIPLENIKPTLSAGDEIVAPRLRVNDDGGVGTGVGTDKREGTGNRQTKLLERLHIRV